ncbi:MAG: ATP synthase F0 subunit B [Gemmataceae bacterium]|nr:ATP synthase F0 subunit B [Gemmataceae bacterium]
MRHTWLFSLVALLGVAGEVPFVWAQEKPDKGGKAAPKYEVGIHDHKTHAHSKKEFDLSKTEHAEELLVLLKDGSVEELALVEPLQPMKIVWDLGLWSVVIFVLLLLILRKLAWGPMLEGLQKREATIRSAVEEAKLARAETQRISTQYQAEMAAKMAEIPKIMEEARRDAENLKEEMRAESAKNIQTERQRLRRELEIARDQVLQELFHKSAQLATLISAKVISRTLTPADHEKLLQLALDELRVSGQRYREEFLKQ